MFIILALVSYRMTLLLGPPGSGKSTLLLALSGKLDKELKVSTSQCNINVQQVVAHNLSLGLPNLLHHCLCLLSDMEKS